MNMTEKQEKIKTLAEDYKMVLNEAKSMGCKNIKALYNILLEDMELIVQSLEKQIPKKPFAHRCTTCGSAVLPFEGSCCSNCGQKLDWSDEKMKENVCITCEYYEECNKPKREIKCIGYKEKEKENE